MTDEEIRALVARLSRPHRDGGAVIERAAILAAGADSAEVLRWITEHDGRAEALAARTSGRGLHSARLDEQASTRAPLRFVLPAEALAAPADPPA